MTDPLLRTLPDLEKRSWEEVLAEAVRPEFRVALYLAGDDDRVLGRPLCLRLSSVRETSLPTRFRSLIPPLEHSSPET